MITLTSRKNKSNLPYFSTEIAVEKTIGEIELILSSNKASYIYKKYDNGQVVAIMFTYNVKGQDINFKLPMDTAKVLEILKQDYRQGKLEGRFYNQEQANRTGWRIIRDWVDSQIALVKVNQVKFEQVFLPYMYNAEKDETLYDQLERKGFNMQIEDKRDNNATTIREDN